MKRARKCEEAKKKFHCLDLAKKIYVSNKYEPSTSTRQCLKRISH